MPFYGAVPTTAIDSDGFVLRRSLEQGTREATQSSVISVNVVSVVIYLFDRRKKASGASFGVRQQRNSDDTKGPKDAVEGTAVVAGDQARASYPVRSRTAHFVRRAGIGAPLLSTHWVERADSTRIG